MKETQQVKTKKQEEKKEDKRTEKWSMMGSAKRILKQEQERFEDAGKCESGKWGRIKGGLGGLPPN